MAEPIGAGPDAILLPALSAISTRAEMQPLAERLGRSLRCHLLDWPGYGSSPADGRLSPGLLDRFLDGVLDRRAPASLVGIAAGHGATYLVRAARRRPECFSLLVLIAPTWRGPLPTMTHGRRPALCRLIRKALEHPIAGPVLYRLNVSKPVVGMMMREHVYEKAAIVTPALIEAKRGIALRPGGRLGTAAFVTGGIDPAVTRTEFLALFDGLLPPVLMLRPRAAPNRSAAEMDALAETGRVDVRTVEGALAPHEEYPDEVAAVIEDRLGACAATRG